MSTFPPEILSDKEGRLSRKIVRRNKNNGKSGIYYVGKQVLGENTIANIGKNIAEFIGKPDFDKYTCHTFRRTGATIIGGSGNMPLLIIAGNWRSDKIPQSYIDDSIETKTKIARFLEERTDRNDFKKNKKNLDSNVADFSSPLGCYQSPGPAVAAPTPLPAVQHIAQQLIFYAPSTCQGFSFGTTPFTLPGVNANQFPVLQQQESSLPAGPPPDAPPDVPIETAPQVVPPPKLVLRIPRSSLL